MDNTVGQKDSQGNVAEEEGISHKNEPVNVKEKEVVKGTDSTSNPYKPNKMFFKNENNIASDLQTSHNSDTDIEKHLSAISDDGVIADKESSGPSGKPIPLEVLSSNKSSSNLVTPKQIIRIERDYTRGEMCQFQSAFPLEIDGRINPRQFQQTINRLNELLSKAFNPKYNCFDNCLACVTIYLSTLCMRSHYDKTIEEICTFLDNENLTLYNLNGLNFRDPRKSSFLFLELELY